MGKVRSRPSKGHVAIGRHFCISAPGKPKGKNPCLHKSRNPGTRNPDVLCGRKEESRKDLDRPSEEMRGEQLEFEESSEMPWAIGSRRTMKGLRLSVFQHP